MSHAVMTGAKPKITCSDSLSSTIRNIVRLAKPYHTVILLYEDDYSDRLLAAWAELDRLNLKTRKVGEVMSGVEVHAFGLEEIKPGTVLELKIRESSQDPARQNLQRSAYKSLLNELTLISVTVRDGRGKM